MTTSLRVLAAGLLLVSVSCATQVGYWPVTEHSYSMKREVLQKEVQNSLQQSGWENYSGVGPYEVHSVKYGPGGQRTVADFRFLDTDRGSGFELTAGSHHVANWATFGILGRSMQEKARQVIRGWLEEWERKHPK